MVSVWPQAWFVGTIGVAPGAPPVLLNKLMGCFQKLKKKYLCPPRGWVQLSDIGTIFKVIFKVFFLEIEIFRHIFGFKTVFWKKIHGSGLLNFSYKLYLHSCSFVMLCLFWIFSFLLAFVQGLINIKHSANLIILCLLRLNI